MAFDRNEQFPPVHPLPEDFSASLRSLDAQLARMARHDRAPAGLSQRVFEASAGLLNAPVAVMSEPKPRLRLVGERGVRETNVARPLHRRFVWSQLAMAACLAIVCVVGLWALQGPTPEAHAEPFDHASALALAFDQSNGGVALHYEANIAHLYETVDLTSEDLTHDLFLLVSRF